MDLKGKVALITGGSMGIGTAISLNLANNGADVALTYRKHEDEAKAIADQINSMGRKGKHYKVDVADFEAAQKLVGSVVEEFGQIDYKIHAAGIVGYRRAKEAAMVLYPHVQLTLVELSKRGLKLAVITDAPREQAWLRLCYLGLHHLFDSVITFEDTYQKKPHPKPFLKVLSLLAVEPENALMVGDWPERDVAGAKKIGIKTVFARYGETFGVVDSGADYEIDDIMSLLTIVDDLNRKDEGDLE